MAGVTKFNNKVLSSKAIICDIEGTTTSISFVKETLFPYALKNVEEYLTANWDEENVKQVVKGLRELSVEDLKNESVSGAIEISAEDSKDAIPSIVKSVQWLMANDRKVGPLKSLQGMIWAKGYKDESIKGHVYEDVAKAFESWQSTGHKIYIYSSGSVDAQKLLFGNSVNGDLMVHLDGYYDTKIGPKQEPKSYTELIKQIGLTAEEILFLTDIAKEADAAIEAGLNVILLDRPGNAKLTDEEKSAYVIVNSFSEIPLESVSTKRKIVEEEEKEEPPTKISKIEEVEPTKVVAVESEKKEEEKMEVDGKVAEAEEKPDKIDTVVVEKMDVNEAKKEDVVDVVSASKTDEKMEEEITKKADDENGAKTNNDVAVTATATNDEQKDAPAEKETAKTDDATVTQKTESEVSTTEEKSTPVEAPQKKEDEKVAPSDAVVVAAVTEEDKISSSNEKTEDKSANGVEEKKDGDKSEATNGVSTTATETNGTSEANGLKNGNGTEEKHDSDKENDEQEKNITEASPAAPIPAGEEKEVDDVVNDIKAKKVAAAADTGVTVTISPPTET